MDRMRLLELRRCYRDGLLEDTLPFWTRHAIDREQGGFLFCLDADGRVVDTDKGLWQHGRFSWLLATLYQQVEERAEWRELAAHGLAFVRSHAFTEEGRAWFQLTRDGQPLRKRRYVFTESFLAIAFGAWHGISGAGDTGAAGAEALRLFDIVLDHMGTPGRIPAKIEASTRPQRGLADPMIRINTVHNLRALLGEARARSLIDSAIEDIERLHCKDDLRACMELVGPQGEVLDHFDGRTLNPGHAIEAAWFILEESIHRGGDSHLRDLGLKILDWMWERGWDQQHGGLLYYVDLHGGPVQEYWHDMKFWWPHCEATIATLMAYRLTGDSRYSEMHRAVHDWAHAHFSDPEHGEWFGYLHRDGSRSSTLKGNLWKGPFHLPRMQLRCWQLVDELLDDRAENANVGSAARQ